MRTVRDGVEIDPDANSSVDGKPPVGGEPEPGASPEPEEKAVAAPPLDKAIHKSPKNK